MSAEYSFDEAEALRHVAKDADVEQLRAAVLAVIDTADSGGYVYDEVRDLKNKLWSALTTEQTEILDEDVADGPAKAPEVHAVTGTHHKADALTVRLRRNRRYVGFQLNTEED